MVHLDPFRALACSLLCMTALSLVGCNCAPEPLALSTTASTVAVDKATIVADGVDLATITITLKSSAGEPIPGGVVTLSTTSGGVQLVQPAAPTDASGVTRGSLTATVAGEKLTTVEVVLKGATVSLPMTATVTALPVVPAGPTKLVFLEQPTDAVAGNAIAPPVRVALQDDSGAIVRGADGAVRLTLMQAGAGGTLSGVALAMSQDGVATFSDLSIDRAAQGYVLVATAGTLPATSSVPFAVSAAAPSALVFTTQPADVVAGVALLPSPVVELRDRFGNLTAATSSITVTPRPAGSCPQAAPTSVAAVAGVASLDGLSLSCADSYTLEAASPGLTPATSQAFVVKSAALDHFGVAASAPAVVAGTGLAVTVTALDAFDNVVTDYVGTVSFSSTDTRATLPGATTFLLADQGRHAFTPVIFRAAGTHTLTVTDGPSTGELMLTVSIGPLATLAFTQQPANGTVRAAFATSPTVTAADAFQNTVASFTGPITLTLSPGAGGLTGIATVNAVAGVATFAGLSVTNEGAGFTLSASAPGASATSAAFDIIDDVTPAPITPLVVTPVSPTSLQVEWLAPGDDGNLGTATSYELRMSLVPFGSGQQGVVVTGVPAPAAPGTQQAFAVTGLLPGTMVYFSLRAIDGAGNGGAPAFANLATDPCPVGTAGTTCADCASGFVRPMGQSACEHVCTAQNPCASPPVFQCASASQLTTYPSPGTCTATSTGPFYSCDYPPTTTPCGPGRACETSGGVGACVDTAPVLVLTVPPSTAAGLPSSVTAGAATTLLITVKDPLGNDFTSYRGTIAFTSTDSAGTLPANYTFTASDNGARTFSGVTFRTAGARSITVTDTVEVTATTTANTNVVAGAATRLEFVQQPGAATVRTSLSPPVTVRAVDDFGNTASADGTTVVMSLGTNPSGTSLVGTTARAIAGGLATFGNLSLDQEGAGYALRASATGLPPATRTAFPVTDDLAPGAPALGFGSISLFSVGVEWTAGGDDGALGDLPASASYVLKYATTPISAANFASTGTLIATTPPLPAGFPEAFTVANLSADRTWFFALQVNDGAGNASYSFASATTLPCPLGATGPTCQQCAGGYVQTGGPGVCTHVCSVANPCSPPANACSGNTLTTYAAVCSPESVPVGGNYYSCSYPPTPTDCTASGQICLGNPTAACVTSPCTAGSCTAIPAPTCTADGTGRITSGSSCTPLTPSTFGCSYPPTTTPCAPAGALCSSANATCYPGVSTPLPNELVITEVQHTAASTAPQGQYFEFFNRTTKNLNVGGLVVTDKLSTSTFTLPIAPLVVPPGTFFVLGASSQAAANGGITVNVAWPGTFSVTKPLAAQVAGLELRVGATVVDDLQWTPAFPSGPDGTAMELSTRILRTARASSRGRPWYWCNATSSLPASSGFGSPGADNGTCGVDAQPVIWCNVQYPTQPSQFPAQPLPSTTAVDLYSQFYSIGGTTLRFNAVDDYPWVEGQLGFDVGGDATTWRFWYGLDFNFANAPGNNDEMTAAQFHFPYTGSFNFGYRYRSLDPLTQVPGPYLYCDRIGVAAGTTGTWGTVTVSGGQPLPE